MRVSFSSTLEGAGRAFDTHSSGTGTDAEMETERLKEGSVGYPGKEKDGADGKTGEAKPGLPKGCSF